jgi:uncharacterized protein YwqG
MDYQQAIERIENSSLSRWAKSLVDLLKPSARVVLRETQGPSGDFSSHFGGLPAVPDGWMWPTWDRSDYVSDKIKRLEDQFNANPRATGLRDIAARMREEELNLGPLPLQFFAQLSLQELASVVTLPGWPSEGTLAFFCDPSSWGFDPKARGHCHVEYFSPGETLKRAPAPEAFPSEAIFPHRFVHFVQEWMLPTGVTLPKSEQRSYRELCEALLLAVAGSKAIHRVGGHPQEIQSDMRLECQLVTNGLYCGDSSGYDDPRAKVLAEGAEDWELLLQVDSDEELAWMWGDAGRVYFWARQQHIDAADFLGSWSILQCY